MHVHVYLFKLSHKPAQDSKGCTVVPAGQVLSMPHQVQMTACHWLIIAAA